MSSLCTDVAGKVDASGLKIEGDQVAQQSEPTTYRLSEDLGCSNNRKVEWTALSSKSAKAYGSEFTPSFNQSGEYVVSAKISNTESGEPVEVSQKTVVVGSQASIVASDVGMAGVALTFDLAVPANSNPAQALWSFGDGKPAQFGLGPLTHTYSSGGTYTIAVAITDATGAITNITRRIVILASTDGFECIGDMTVSGPTTGTRGVPVTWGLFLPPCMVSMVHHVTWSFNDSAPAVDGLSATRTYNQVGTYTIKIEIYNDDTAFPLVTLNRQIEISEPELPPEDPGNCVLGTTRDSYSNQVKEEVGCGVLGTKENSYRDHVVETCQASSPTVRRYVETSRTKELVQEGECKGQYCLVPSPDINVGDILAMGFVLIDGKYYIADGASQGFYPSQTPAGQCVKQNRTCDNGVLSGSAVYLTCKNGCEGLGPDGTVRTGVVTGSETVAHQCAFGETGINDQYTILADQKCADGVTVVSNTRRGSLTQAGVCPTYSWNPTANYSACSADCGGQQNLIYECRDGAGNAAPSERCTSEAPVQTRVCDGNPAAVRTVESVTNPEDAGSSNSCPKNQIGVITKTRDVTVTKTFACIDHAVALESEKTEYGEWQVENYCRDYVAHRCSQDSLNNTEAHGRYLWMVKCKAQVPMIKEFLEKFDDIKVSGINIDTTKRVLYPTFMNRAKKPEAPWIAPKLESGSCTVPSTVYIAAVCLSSCATPEQQILTQTARGEKPQYATFLEALTNNHPYVTTLRSESNMRTRITQNTKVDQWVTELIDGDHKILDFRLQSGGVLRLTPNHPVVTSDGMLKTAGEFKVGEDFVKLGGALDPIVGITERVHHGKVYNVFVQSADPLKNIVVTNGYLNGTAFYQNEGGKFMNRRVFQTRMIQGVFSK